MHTITCMPCLSSKHGYKETPCFSHCGSCFGMSMIADHWFLTPQSPARPCNIGLYFSEFWRYTGQEVHRPQSLSPCHSSACRAVLYHTGWRGWRSFQWTRVFTTTTKQTRVSFTCKYMMVSSPHLTSSPLLWWSFWVWYLFLLSK